MDRERHIQETKIKIAQTYNTNGLRVAAYWYLYFEKVLVMIRIKIEQKKNRQLLSHLLIPRYKVLHNYHSVT